MEQQKVTESAGTFRTNKQEVALGTRLEVVCSKCDKHTGWTNHELATAQKPCCQHCRHKVKVIIQEDNEEWKKCPHCKWWSGYTVKHFNEVCYSSSGLSIPCKACGKSILRVETSFQKALRSMDEINDIIKAKIAKSKQKHNEKFILKTV